MEAKIAQINAYLFLLGFLGLFKDEESAKTSLDRSEVPTIFAKKRKREQLQYKVRVDEY